LKKFVNKTKKLNSNLNLRQKNIFLFYEVILSNHFENTQPIKKLASDKTTRVTRLENFAVLNMSQYSVKYKYTSNNNIFNIIPCNTLKPKNIPSKKLMDICDARNILLSKIL